MAQTFNLNDILALAQTALTKIQSGELSVQDIINAAVSPTAPAGTVATETTIPAETPVARTEEFEDDLYVFTGNDRVEIYKERVDNHYDYLIYTSHDGVITTGIATNVPDYTSTMTRVRPHRAHNIICECEKRIRTEKFRKVRALLGIAH